MRTTKMRMMARTASTANPIATVPVTVVMLLLLPPP